MKTLALLRVHIGLIALCPVTMALLMAARAQDGRFVIAYTPRGQLLSIQMNKVAGTKVKARYQSAVLSLRR